MDLASLASVCEFCNRVIAAGGADLLLLNAGIMAPPERLTTSDGFELQFGTNYLGHWLIANRLVMHRREWRRQQRRRHEQQQQTPGGLAARATRTIFFSSMTHWAGTLDFSDLQASRDYDGFRQYAATKLACLLAAKEMQRRLDGYAATMLIGACSVACCLVHQ